MSSEVTQGCFICPLLGKAKSLGPGHGRGGVGPWAAGPMGSRSSALGLEDQQPPHRRVPTIPCLGSQRTPGLRDTDQEAQPGRDWLTSPGGARL